MKLTILIACLMFGTAALAADAGAELFQKAVTEERAAGNLEEAIKLYQRVAKEFASDRALAAKALVQEARCYEKLGQDKAVKLYEQVARDFSDQREPATQARARLAALKQDDSPAAPATMTQRRIESTLGGMGPGMTDGHRAVYMNDATGELIYGDLAGKSKRVIFKTKPDDLPPGFPSRDFSIVALAFDSKPLYALSVVNTDGTGYREIARLGTHYGCLDWSWDNRYILACSHRDDGPTRLLKISVADGQIHELVSLKTGWMRSAAFSPDGRFVAYQVPASSAADPVSRIFILPAEGGEPQLVYEERPSAGLSRNRQPLRLLDWTVDGRYLAIGSQRTGKGALHLLPIKDGKPAGAPVFVKYGDFEYGSTTAAGGMIYDAVKPGGEWAVYTASLDEHGRPGGWRRLDLPLGNTTNPWPEWSGDSNRIVYVGRNEDSGQTGGEVVHLRDLTTGEDREIYHALGHTTCTWAVQQPKLFCADNRAEKTDILSIAVESGQVERLHTSPAPLFILYPSRDDRALYLNGGNEEEEILRLDIATGQETILERFPSGVWGLVSPDERWLIRKGAKGADIRPMSGGDWKALVSSTTSAQDSAAPDGNWLFYRDADAAGKKGLYRVATAGGQPERLGDFPTNGNGGGTMEISPDGRTIMVAGMFGAGWELWSLENFIPPAH